ncbi:MAG: sigma-70 family RNA polymerase sigma factor [Myxococcaceae bacterium]|nr:sigma-70 family RNA polymerase sigma factor [Myxococcaceae bacterium]
MSGGEAHAKALHGDGAFDACAAEALRLYGAEVEGYVRATVPARVDPDEVWAATCAAMVEGLPRFQWRSTLRTWLYQVARFTLRQLGDQARRVEGVPLSQVTRPSKLEARVSVKPSFLSETVQAKLGELREGLDEEDRTLLYLRIERDLPWRDIAELLVEQGEDVDARAAALRKRFERVKQRLREVLEPARSGGL